MHSRIEARSRRHVITTYFITSLLSVTTLTARAQDLKSKKEPTVTIEPATVDDIDAMVEIARLRMADPNKKNREDAESWVEVGPSNFKDYLTHPSFTPFSRMHVARVDDTVAAWAFSIDAASGVPIHRHYYDKLKESGVNIGESPFYLYQIYSHPEFAGNGYGRKIIDELIKEADQARRPTLLSVHKSNHRALKLYKELGFQHTGVITPSNSLLMRRAPSNTRSATTAAHIH